MKFILVILLISISTATYSNNNISVVVGLSKPPYVIKEGNTGFELELVREVFKGMGLSVNFIYTPYGHSLNMLAVEGVDAVMTTNDRVFAPSQLSDVYITYQNIAVSLKNNDFSISSIAELSNYTIASFQKAKKVLGPEFASAAVKSPLFMEISEQQSQTSLLIKKRVQLAVIDKHIFSYYLEQQKLTEEFTIHNIFPSNPYCVAFKDPENIERFNQSLKTFFSSNKYHDLLIKYNLKSNIVAAKNGG